MHLSIQLQQGVEHRRQVGQMGPHIPGGAMEQMLEAADDRQHGQDRLQYHALVPRPLGTELEVLWSGIPSAHSKPVSAKAR